MDVEQELIELLLNWDQLERQNGGEVIDFNLLGRRLNKPTKLDRYQILQRLKEIAARIDDVKLTRRITAHIYYLQALMGQQYSFAKYIENTQHIPVITLDDIKLVSAHDDLKTALNDLGVSLNEKASDELDALDETVAPKELDDYFQESFTDRLSILENTLERSIIFNLQIELVEEDAYWACWVDGQQNSFRLRINLRRTPVYTKTKALALVYHELLAHCAQMAIWKERIDAGAMSPVWGLTTVHGPEQFLFEGLAQTLPLFVGDDYTANPILAARIRLSHFRNLIHNNVHVMINTGSSVEDCVDYMLRHLPWSKPADIVRDLESRSNNVLFKSYQYVYPSSFDFFMGLAEKLSDPAKRRFLKDCYQLVLFHDDLVNKRY